MDKEAKQGGRIEYMDEGFTIDWDEKGLLIQVTDYHAKPLKLAWRDILSLAKTAGSKDKAAGEK